MQGCYNTFYIFNDTPSARRMGKTLKFDKEIRCSRSKRTRYNCRFLGFSHIINEWLCFNTGLRYYRLQTVDI